MSNILFAESKGRHAVLYGAQNTPRCVFFMDLISSSQKERFYDFLHMEDSEIITLNRKKYMLLKLGERIPVFLAVKLPEAMKSLRADGSQISVEKFSDLLHFSSFDYSRKSLSVEETVSFIKDDLSSFADLLGVNIEFKILNGENQPLRKRISEMIAVAKVAIILSAAEKAAGGVCFEIHASANQASISFLCREREFSFKAVKTLEYITESLCERDNMEKQFLRIDLSFNIEDESLLGMKTPDDTDCFEI